MKFDYPHIKTAILSVAVFFFVLTYWYTYRIGYTAGEDALKTKIQRATIESSSRSREVQERAINDEQAEISIILQDDDGDIPAVLRKQLERMYTRHGERR